jgi:hypothetical protein
MHVPATAIAVLLSSELLFFPSSLAAAPAAAPKPSRKPEKGCTWQKLSDPAAGLEVFAQKCDFGFRKIDFLFEKNALLIRYSDGGKPDPVVEVFDLKAGETPEAGVKRLWTERTPKFLQERCLMVPYRDGRPPTGAKWLTFDATPAWDRELKKKQDPGDIPEPPCGDWGIASDGIQYWEIHPGDAARRVLFVRVGQDTPLYDERTLRLLPAPAPPAR